MRALEDYLYDMEAASDEPLTGQGFVAPVLEVVATGTCGVTTPAWGVALPALGVDASGDWQPVGIAALPAMEAVGAQALWLPGWADLSWPLVESTGQAGVHPASALALSSLFGAMLAGAQTSRLSLPVPTPYGLSGLDRQGAVACTLNGPTAMAWSCGLDDPTANDTSSATVVGLLCQGDDQLALAAAGLAQGATVASTGADTLAGALLDALGAGLAYVADSDGDVWTCALGTYFRGFGDCEDGAILLHGLLLAAGVGTDRLVTAFGRVDVDRQGHAWLTYRRQSDGQWVVLDWTSDPADTDVTKLTPIQSLPYYAMVDYALTGQAFFAVRQSASTFFTRVDVEDLALPALESAAAATLGTTAVCAWNTHWLRATARTGSRGQGVLPAATSTGRSGSHAASLRLTSQTVQAHGGAGGDTMLPETTLLGAALGASGRSGRLALEVSLAVEVVQDSFGTAALRLARARMRAAGLAGQGGAAEAALREMVLRAHGWPGTVARMQACLAGADGIGRGRPSDPGLGLVTLPPWQGSGLGLADGSDVAAYHWNTTSMEAW